MSIGHLEKITKLMYEKSPDKSQKGDFRINVAFKDILNINESMKLGIDDQEQILHFNTTMSRIISVALTIMFLPFVLSMLMPLLELLTHWTHQFEPSDSSTVMSRFLIVCIMMYRFLVSIISLILIIKYLYKGFRYVSMKILNYIYKRIKYNTIIEPLTVLMNQVFINKHDKFDFLFLGECLDPDYSTSNTLSFIIPEGYVNLDVEQKSLTNSEKRALIKVLDIDRFSSDEVFDYYESLINITDVKDINYQIAATEEQMDLMEQFRERRGDGNHQMLNQRFKTTLDKLNEDIDDTVEQSYDYIKKWSEKDNDSHDYIETKHIKDNDGVSKSVDSGKDVSKKSFYKFKPNQSFTTSREKRRIKRLSDFDSIDDDLDNQSY